MNQSDRATNPNVVMITGVYFPEINGATLQCMKVISLLKREVDFKVITTTKYSNLVDYKVVDEVDIFRFYTGNYFSKFLQVIKIFLVFFTKKIDIVHLHGFSSRSAIIVLISRLFNKKIIIKMTSFGHDDVVSIKNKGKWLFHVFSLADIYIGVSPIFKRAHLKSALNVNKYYQIPNGVDINLFKPLSNKEKSGLRFKLGLPIDMKLILVIGHFSVEKSMDHVLDAWITLQESFNIESGIVFIGNTNGHDFEVDESIVNSMRSKSKPFIGKNVFFVERAVNIEQYYQSSDIYVLSSAREGLPNTLLEAMSCALPVVSTRLDGVTDWVVNHQYNGMMYNHGDIDDLIFIIENLLKDSELAQRLGVNAQKTIKNNFDILTTANKIHCIYENLRRSA
ncbi:glycosyltransferase family 4 protein [Candidatus Woesearchaeota archaeon]|nr:glycosyltransferase family 4 protein [Candidatus Woesearchaeota archaeon]MBT7556046.1 glycosyltransferase family 4 protein [Candidatus Woesearchaeota archaeon]